MFLYFKKTDFKFYLLFLPILVIWMALAYWWYQPRENFESTEIPPAPAPSSDLRIGDGFQAAKDWPPSPPVIEE